MDQATPEVLILTPFFSPNVGGVETHLTDLCDHLRMQDWVVNVLTYQPLTTRARGPIREHNSKLHIYRVPWFGYGWFHVFESIPVIQFLYLTPGLLLATFFFLMTHKKSVGVIHAHGLTAALVARILKPIFHTRVVVSIHAIYNFSRVPQLAWLVQRILVGAERILALSEQSRQELISIGVPGERVACFTYWVDQTLFRPLDKTACKNSLDLGGSFVALFVGRLIPIKGVDLIIDLARSFPLEARFVLIGDGPLADHIRSAEPELANLRFIGRVPNADLPRFYNAADVVLVPSQYEEGFGRVILEAISCGTPVLASNMGGIPEAVNSSVAVLVEPTLEQMRTELLRLATQPGRLKQMANNCRGYAEANFGSPNAAKIVSAYWG